MKGGFLVKLDLLVNEMHQETNLLLHREYTHEVHIQSAMAQMEHHQSIVFLYTRSMKNLNEKKNILASF